MTTAQQLGLVGNSVRVQALPTASAETFGQGNRYYTLIGQQEGYITGHTYHTVVANDVYSWEDVACGNYNMLDNIPVINQDLTASGFTPVANTYYRHTGATNNTFTQGVIYLYDTAYHKLGESGGGGTTLNKYNYSGNDIALARKIMENAQLAYINRNIANTPCALLVVKGTYNRANGAITNADGVAIATITDISNALYLNTTTLRNKNNELTMTTNESSLSDVSIVYFNDTEITA